MTEHRPAAVVPGFLRSRRSPLSARIARQRHVVPPDEPLDCPAGPWADALAVLEAGCLEVRSASAGPLHLCPGAIFTLRGLTPAVLTAAGPDPAVISTLHHRTEGDVP